MSLLAGGCWLGIRSAREIRKEKKEVGTEEKINDIRIKRSSANYMKKDLSLMWRGHENKLNFRDATLMKLILILFIDSCFKLLINSEIEML